jgi:Acetyltransferase (GNAT) family
MQAAIDWAKQVGAHRVSLTVFPHNHAARALYAKFGFMTEGTLHKAIRRQDRELWDAVVMGLLLDTEALRTTRRPSLHLPDEGLSAGHLLLGKGAWPTSRPWSQPSMTLRSVGGWTTSLPPADEDWSARSAQMRARGSKPCLIVAEQVGANTGPSRKDESVDGSTWPISLSEVFWASSPSDLGAITLSAPSSHTRRCRFRPRSTRVRRRG